MANSRNGRPARRRPETPATPSRNPRKPAHRRQKHTDAPRRHKRTGLLLRLLTMLVVVAVFILGVAIFFKVSEIQVTGNNLYTADQVVEASGIGSGDNLMTLGKASAAGRIIALLPYVEAVQIERILPDTVVIHVQESDAVYAVAADDGTSWLMNGSGKILEQADVSATGYPRLLGITAQAPESGMQIVCEETENLEAAMTVIELLETTDFISQITEINVEKSYDIIVWYGDQLEIHLGGTNEMEYKMQFLAAVLENDQVQAGGVIDLTLEEKNVAIFKPWGSSQDLTSDSDEISSDN